MNGPDRRGGLSTEKLFKLFMALTAFHLVVSLSMYAIANTSLLASYHNGRGLWNFAMDSFTYHKLGLHSCHTLTDQGFAAWWNEEAIRHTKWIALAYYIFGPYPVSFAPVNALAWAAAIVLVYLIASRLFPDSGRVPLVSALLYGFMPSSLLSATQLMRDPFYNLGVLMIVLGWVSLLSGRARYVFALLAALGLVFCEHIRPEPFWLLMGVSVLAAALVAASGRKAVPHALLALMLVAGFYQLPPLPSFAGEPHAKSAAQKAAEKGARIASAKNEIRARLGAAYTGGLDGEISKWFSLPRLSSWTLEAKEQKLIGLAEEHGKNLEPFLAKWNTNWTNTPWLPRKVEALIKYASYHRDAFLVWYLVPGSSLADSDVMFRSAGDIMLYTPRAFQLGFFSLFPQYWLTSGKTGGGAIRLVGGAETLVIYFLYVGFLIFLARAPVRWPLKLWLSLFMFVMVMPLGYFVPNIGTLFRMRYVYLAPALIGGVWGLGAVAARLAARRAAQNA